MSKLKSNNGLPSSTVLSLDWAYVSPCVLPVLCFNTTTQTCDQACGLTQEASATQRISSQLPRLNKTLRERDVGLHIQLRKCRRFKRDQCYDWKRFELPFLSFKTKTKQKTEFESLSFPYVLNLEFPVGFLAPRAPHREAGIRQPVGWVYIGKVE